jgi:hypothetical protein
MKEKMIHYLDCICKKCERKWYNVDKAYKKLGKEAKKIEKDTKEVLKKDKSRDKLVAKGKKAMKRGC